VNFLTEGKNDGQDGVMHLHGSVRGKKRGKTSSTKEALTKKRVREQEEGPEPRQNSMIGDVKGRLVA